MTSPLRALNDGERRRLRDLGFDSPVFERLVMGLRQGTLPGNAVEGTVEAPRSGDILPLAPAGTMEGDALADAGQQLLGAGRAGLVVLNGGMATRFGGRVKGIVEALPGRSFLQLQCDRLASIRSATGRAAPLLVMNSEATAEATTEHLEANDWFGLDRGDVRCFEQTAAPRVRPDGSLYRDGAGEISVYGPGHGDLAVCLRTSGALQWAVGRGVEYLLMANVDNLGATLDGPLLGRFAASGADMMVEVAPKAPGDKGGAPARVDGRVQIVEGFAFPAGFDQDSIDVFNTNTLWFRSEALDQDFPMSWYVVHKEAAGDPVVQFERLIGQLSWFLPTEWVQVSRERFRPVKTPEDLEALQPVLRAMFGTTLRVL